MSATTRRVLSFTGLVGILVVLPDELGACLDAHDLARAGFGQGIGPSAVLGREVEHPGARDVLQVRRDEELVSEVQPP